MVRAQVPEWAETSGKASFPASVLARAPASVQVSVFVFDSSSYSRGAHFTVSVRPIKIVLDS